MSIPKQRLTITLAEYNLLKPGLDLVANRLADANSGNFPYRIAWEVAGTYREQECDPEMSARFIRARSKLWELTESRKVYLDAWELAALALALRLGRSRKLVEVTDGVSTEIKLLQVKIERYRKRAKRSAIAKLGRLEYSAIARRWRRNVAWLRCNCLCIRRPKFGPPWRANSWRDQRQQAAQLIKTVLEENFYEALTDKQMARLVILLTTTLHRCRYAVGLKEIVLAPQKYTDYLVGFVAKRMELKRLPGAPVSALQAVSDRADKFREYQQKAREGITTPTETGQDRIMTAEQAPQVASPPKVKAPRRYTHNHQVLTADTLIDALAEWFYETVTLNFNFTREVCEHAKFQIVNELLEPHQGKIAATSVRGLIKGIRSHRPVRRRIDSDWSVLHLAPCRSADLSPAAHVDVPGN